MRRPSKRLNCLVCGAEFIAYQCKIDTGRAKYCSRACSDEITMFKKGHRASVATEIKKGVPLPQSWKDKMKGRVPVNKGKKGLQGAPSNAFKKGQRPSIATEFKVGTPIHLHPRWQGGKSYEEYPITWSQELRRRIRARDYHTCQSCGAPEIECTQRLHVHHIDYDKNNTSEHNLISLCQRCHHKTNSNRNVWQSFFEGVMSNVHCREDKDIFITKAE